MSFITDTIKMFGTQQGQMVVYGLLALAMSGAALAWAKYPGRWLLAIVCVGLTLWLYWYVVPELDEELPWVFLVPRFRGWLLFLSLGSLLLLSHLGWVAVRRFFGLGATPVDEAGAAFPDLDAAWQDVLNQLSQQSIDLSKQDLYLLMSTSEPVSASVVLAAEMSLHAYAPGAPDAPIHVYATATGVYLSLAGASHLGRMDAEAKARLEWLCKQIVNASAGVPTLRGIAVLLPIGIAREAASTRRSEAIRNDLQAIRRAFRVNCPTVVAFCVHDELPGFTEYTERLGEERRQRTGFSLPTSVKVTDEVIRQGFDWETRWIAYDVRCLMGADVYKHEGNRRLMALNLAFRDRKAEMATLIQSAVTLHRQQEPILFRGCYLVVHGHGPDWDGFANGLLGGTLEGRVPADKDLTTWSRDADDNDRTYYVAAIGLGILAAVVALPIWWREILSRLKVTEVNLGGLGLTTLGVLCAAWIFALGLPPIRRRLARLRAAS